MKLEQKRKIVERLKENLEKARSAVFIGFSGLETSSMNQLRDKLLEVEGQLQVAKNTLIARALSSVREQMPNAKCQMEDKLVGPTAIVFAFSDPLPPLRTLVEFGGELEGLELKGGIFEGVAVSSAELFELARIPGREGLLVQLASLLSSPLRRFLVVAKGPIQRFAGVIDSLSCGRA